jgi:hypothetical protein
MSTGLSIKERFCIETKTDSSRDRLYISKRKKKTLLSLKMGSEIVLIVALSIAIVLVFGWLVHALIKKGRMSPITAA